MILTPFHIGLFLVLLPREYAKKTAKWILNKLKRIKDQKENRSSHFSYYDRLMIRHSLCTMNCCSQWLMAKFGHLSPIQPPQFVAVSIILGIISSSVPLILPYRWIYMESVIMPIGWLSEAVQEARKKDFKRFGWIIPKNSLVHQATISIISWFLTISFSISDLSGNHKLFLNWKICTFQDLHLPIQKLLIPASTVENERMRIEFCPWCDLLKRRWRTS